MSQLSCIVSPPAVRFETVVNEKPARLDPAPFVPHATFLAPAHPAERTARVACRFAQHWNSGAQKRSRKGLSWARGIFGSVEPEAQVGVGSLGH
ncbi:hypothetical protein [Mesorhizobium sp. Z1-4]|uniref:hypothetical protein n=1 Tax=Mesorhizobium sp. Z1-4 TaxID=2448478 RepID=UPI001FE1A5D9|nr:hypothetical protein [Mesorhizobium sp. Z1-4]